MVLWCHLTRYHLFSLTFVKKNNGPVKKGYLRSYLPNTKTNYDFYSALAQKKTGIKREDSAYDCKCIRLCPKNKIMKNLFQRDVEKMESRKITLSDSDKVTI